MGEPVEPQVPQTKEGGWEGRVPESGVVVDVGNERSILAPMVGDDQDEDAPRSVDAVDATPKPLRMSTVGSLGTK